MRPAQFLPIGLTAAVILACGGDDLILPSDGDPASITIVQGDSLTGRVGERLAQPLVIEVLDGADRPMANARVAIDLTGASAEPDTLTTDEAGRASAEIT